MFTGIDNKELSAKDRLSLLSRSQVMYINGKSMEEIEAYAREFSSPRIKSFQNIGVEFSQYMGALGYLSVFFMLSLHWAWL